MEGNTRPRLYFYLQATRLSHDLATLTQFLRPHNIIMHAVGSPPLANH